MIRYHPTIGQVHTFLKLDRNHFGVNLHYGTLKPISDPLTITIMITEYFDMIPDFILLFKIRGVREM
jgi:hypothetical protein